MGDAIRQCSFDLVLEGGLGGVAVDDAGRLRPLACWTARRDVAVEELIERMRAGCAVAPPAVAKSGEAATRADLRVLYRALGSATFRESGAVLRPLSDTTGISVSAPFGVKYIATVTPVFDLPDGTILGPAGGVWVRLPRDTVHEAETDAPGPREVSTTALSTEIRVVAGTLGTIGAALLDAEPALRDIGALHDHLPPRDRQYADEEPARAAERAAMSKKVSANRKR